jgi:hypothetical protein
LEHVHQALAGRGQRCASDLLFQLLEATSQPDQELVTGRGVSSDSTQELRVFDQLDRTFGGPDQFQLQLRQPEQTCKPEEITRPEQLREDSTRAGATQQHLELACDNVAHAAGGKLPVEHDLAGAKCMHATTDRA